jgi:extracellular elastinolytic metalloproteinase
MGLVQCSNRHTALDADVVFHEFTHGLTNRLVGGTRQGHTLDAPQSQGMDEGWSDFFALTIQNFFRTPNHQAERVIIGDWVVNDQTGIRSNPYDDNLHPRQRECAALLMMVRRMRASIG